MAYCWVTVWSGSNFCLNIILINVWIALNDWGNLKLSSDTFEVKSKTMFVYFPSCQSFDLIYFSKLHQSKILRYNLQKSIFSKEFNVKEKHNSLFTRKKSVIVTMTLSIWADDNVMKIVHWYFQKINYKLNRKTS